MEKELTISFPGSSIGNSDFYNEQTESTEKEETYQELFFTTSKNAKRRLRGWLEYIEAAMDGIRKYDSNDQLNAYVICTKLSYTEIEVRDGEGNSHVEKIESAVHANLRFIIDRLDVVTNRKRTEKAFPPEQMNSLIKFKEHIQELLNLINNCSAAIRKFESNKSINNLIEDIVKKNDDLFDDLAEVRSFVVYNKELNFDIK
jgi:hypothetical protein